MAERRMFHTAVVESDAFLDMPIGAQALYFHLGMHADDDGFVNGPRQIARTLQLSQQELQILEDVGFIMNFDGIVVIKHWRTANCWKSDRLQLPRYPELAEKLFLVDEKFYTQEQVRGAKTLLQIKKKLIRQYGIHGESQKKREEKKKEEKKRKENRINQKNIEEKKKTAAQRLSTTAAGVVGEGAPVDGGDAPAIVPDFGKGGENYDDTYVLLHRFGKDVVKLNKDQIEGLRRIMDEVDLDIYVHRLAKQILEGNDPGAHYKTIKGWYEERRNGQYEA